MRRSILFSGPFSLLKAGSACAFVLAAILSCSDNTTAPVATAPNPLGGYTVVGHVADSLKHPSQAVSSSNSFVSPRIANNVIASPTQASSASLSAPTYTVTSVDFRPEAAPQYFVLKGDDDVHYNTEIGFDFTFYGKTYHQVNIAANGFVAFDTLDDDGGCCVGHVIPLASDAPYNNLIAVTWTDLNSSNTGDIRAETQGSAPHRKFVVQYNNVPEYYNGPGRVTAQLVLSEGSNDITINTFSNTIVSSMYHAVTQGIENADGTEAEFMPGRVHSLFALTNDAVRFSLAHTNQPPVITAPPNLSVTTSPPASASIGLRSFGLGVGSCVAVVNPGAATANDDADGVTIAGARSDGLLLDAAYPKGMTTITWTATDAGGLTATASQTVTVNDSEKPSVKPPADISTRIDRSATTATVAVGSAAAFDNCPDVSVAGARSDGAALSAAYPIGLTTVAWTATDASGNTSSANQLITVVGNKPPVIAAPTMLVVNTDPGVCMASVSVATPGVTDDAEGTTIVSRRSDGQPLAAAFPKGMTTITWTATDADGATSSATQTVTVNDGEKPSFISKPADISTGNDHGLASALVAVSRPSALDNCHEVSVDGSRSDGAALDAPYNVGVTTINWMARDAASNSATTTQAITVLDKEAPTINVPADMRVNATLPGGEYVSYTASWSDNVGVTSGSCAPLSGAMFPIGSTTVNCSASDAAGNRASTSFVVTVAGSAEQRMSLIEYVLSRNLPNGITNPLVAQLRAAARTNDNHVSCIKMSDFTKMVVKDGNGIPDTESWNMIDKATDIMAVLGCPDGATPTSGTRNMSMSR
jgi:HYR domain